MSESTLPHVTADLPGVGGVLRQSDDDFRVDEILAYEPEDRGDHLFVRIEKRGLTTTQAADMLARALGVPGRDLGWAGMKDKHAVTRQTLSLPPPCTPEAVAALRLPGIDILGVRRHRHKLRTGHLRGNRFVLRLRELDVPAPVAAERARAVLDALARPPGGPNWFGAQRFGPDGKNAEIGRALLLGLPLPDGMRPPRGKALRLYASALQSELFNEVVRRRLVDGCFGRVLHGDLLQKRDTGGMFFSDDPALDQARLDQGQIVITGPMVGHRMRACPEGSEAARREQAVLDDHGLTAAAFARLGKLAQGTRRPIAVLPAEVSVVAIENAIEVCFALSAGSYATAVLREVVKGPTTFPG